MRPNFFGSVRHIWRRPVFLVAFGVAFLGAAFSNGATLPRYGIFDYGKLCSSKESGDVDGYRIIVIREREGDYVLFEEASGALALPVADVPEINTRTSAITFKLHSTDPGRGPIFFKGKMTALALVGTIEWRGVVAGKEELTLPRAGLTPSEHGCQ